MAKMRKTWKCDSCGFSITRVRDTDTKENRFYVDGQEMSLAISEQNLFAERRCFNCRGRLLTEQNCLKCKWLTEKVEIVEEKIGYRFIKKKERSYYCSHPEVHEKVRSFERAIHCKVFFNKEKHATLEGFM